MFSKENRIINLIEYKNNQKNSKDLSKTSENVVIEYIRPEENIDRNNFYSVKDLLKKKDPYLL